MCTRLRIVLAQVHSPASFKRAAFERVAAAWLRPADGRRSELGAALHAIFDRACKARSGDCAVVTATAGGACLHTRVVAVVEHALACTVVAMWTVSHMVHGVPSHAAIGVFGSTACEVAL